MVSGSGRVKTCWCKFLRACFYMPCICKLCTMLKVRCPFKVYCWSLAVMCGVHANMKYSFCISHPTKYCFLMPSNELEHVDRKTVVPPEEKLRFNGCAFLHFELCDSGNIVNTLYTQSLLHFQEMTHVRWAQWDTIDLKM